LSLLFTDTEWSIVDPEMVANESLLEELSMLLELSALLMMLPVTVVPNVVISVHSVELSKRTFCKSD